MLSLILIGITNGAFVQKPYFDKALFRNLSRTQVSVPMAQELQEEGKHTEGQQNIEIGGLYSIHAYWKEQDYAYLSYETSSGWCRQIYEKSSDSKFQLLNCNANKNLYYIKNKWEDKRLDHWLSYGNCEERQGKSMVGLYTNLADRAIWELIPQKEPMTFKIKCHYNDQFKGWLSFQWDGRWNGLYEQEDQATVYKFESYQ